MQVAKIFILYAVAIFAIRPQLRWFRLLLQNHTLSYLSGNIPNRKIHRTISSVWDKSPACRAAFAHSASGLGVAKLLRHMDELDLLQFQRSSSARIGLLALVTTALPFVAYTLLGESAGDLVVDMALPAASSFFVLANSYLLQISLAARIAIYAGGLAVYFGKKGLFSFVVKTAISAMHETDVEQRQQAVILGIAAKAQPLASRSRRLAVEACLHILTALLQMSVNLYNAVAAVKGLLFADKTKDAEASRMWQQMCMPAYCQASTAQIPVSCDDDGHQRLLPDRITALRVHGPNSAALPAAPTSAPVGYIDQLLHRSLGCPLQYTLSDGHAHGLHPRTVSTYYKDIQAVRSDEDILHTYRFQEPWARRYAADHLTVVQLSRLVMTNMLKIFLDKHMLASQLPRRRSLHHILSSQFQLLDSGDNQNMRLAYELVKSGVEEPLHVADMLTMMREVWATVPFRRHALNTTTCKDFLTCEEVQEIVADFHCWVHSCRKDGHGSTVPYAAFFGYVQALVGRMLLLIRREQQRAGVKVFRPVGNEKMSVRIVSDEEQKDEQLLLQGGCYDEDEDDAVEFGLGLYG